LLPATAAGDCSWRMGVAALDVAGLGEGHRKRADHQRHHQRDQDAWLHRDCGAVAVEPAFDEVDRKQEHHHDCHRQQCLHHRPGLTLVLSIT
jgi:hypothetical protein